MADNTTKADKKHKEPKLPFDANHPYHPDYKGDNPRGVANGEGSVDPITTIATEEHEHTTEKEMHAHDHGSVNLEQSHRAEQQRKTQQQEQNDREAFPKGLAQNHVKGRG